MEASRTEPGPGRPAEDVGRIVSSMDYLFRGRWYDAPEPAARPSCAVVEVHSAVPVVKVEPTDCRVVRRDVRKLWRFVAAEGIGATIRKARSKMLEERRRGDFHVVAAVGTRTGSSDPVLCLGTKHPRFAERMLFHEDLVAHLNILPSTEDLAAACETAVRSAGPDAVAEAAGYDLASPFRPPPGAVRLLEALVEHLAGAAPAAGARPARPGRPEARRMASRGRRAARGGVGALVVGAGDYTRAIAAPALARAGARLEEVVDLDPLLAALVRDACGFAHASTDWRRAVASPDVDLVVVASYHDSHATIASAALAEGKRVLVEKPPAVTVGDLGMLADAARRPGAFLEVGYNRRFAPFTRLAAAALGEARGPVAITCIVQELPLPAGHWYHWPNQGSRIAGNLCHWLDLAVLFAGVERTVVDVSLLQPREGDAAVAVAFDDGSLAAIVSTTRGDTTLGVQEFIQARRGDVTVRIDDFRTLTIERAGRPVQSLRRRRDKGHRAMYAETLERLRTGAPPSYTVAELVATTSLTLRVSALAHADSFATEHKLA